jgi:hypothetical protein
LIIVMSVFLSLYLRVCDFGYCKLTPVDTAVIAITSCESGDGHNFGTIKWDAVSKTNDTGAFQFNDRTWRWLTNRNDRAMDAPHSAQLMAFYKLWNDGYGHTHWSASQPCWSQWLEIKNGRAVAK